MPSLVTLLWAADKAWPESHAADGTKAGAGHLLRSPKSDHTPDIVGWVRAEDIGEVTVDVGFKLAEALRFSRDLRIKYVIHERAMFSSYDHPNGKAFEWRTYSGSNGHWSHVHISVYRINQLDTSPWSIGAEGTSIMGALTALDLQEALNIAGVTDLNGDTLKPDDDFGPLTQSAWVKALTLFNMENIALLDHEHDVALLGSVPPHGHIGTTTVGRITPS